MNFHKRKWKIGIAIPAPQQVSPDFSLSNLPAILGYTRDKFPKSKLIIKHQTGVRTDKNRNIMVKEFLEEHKVDFILHLDADEIYPPDIIERYLEANENDKIDIIGAYYFKRAFPYHPIGYVLNTGDDKETKPYKQLMPQFVERGVVYEVDGLGFGGMFVARHVYEGMGKDKWTHYGVNFHIPEETTDGLTHDLQFCHDAKKHGFSIRLHGSIRPGHIGEILVTEKDCIDNMEITLKRTPEILVIMPHIDEKQATKTASIIKSRAGINHKLLLVEDKKRQGFVKTINHAARHNKAELYVYTAQDVFVSRGWLYEAVIAQAKAASGVTALNDGKWHGSMAQFGMVTGEFADKFFKGGLFPDCYNSNYCDVEISQIAKEYNRYAYAEKSIMMEIDYKKEFTGKVNTDDKTLFNERKKTGFGGLVTNKKLLEQFS